MNNNTKTISDYRLNSAEFFKALEPYNDLKNAIINISRRNEEFQKIYKLYNSFFPTISEKTIKSIKTINEISKFANQINLLQESQVYIYWKIKDNTIKEVNARNNVVYINAETGLKAAKKEIGELKLNIEKLKTENKDKDKEIERLKKTIEILNEQNEMITKFSDRCPELVKLINYIKNNPACSQKDCAINLHKSLTTIKTQLKEICEKIYNIPDYETKGLKTVKSMIFTDKKV